MTRKPGKVLEKYEGLHFETEIRFDKSDGEFSAELPPGHEPVKSKVLKEVRDALVNFNRTYQSPGGWKKMIYIRFSSEEPRGGSNSHVGHAISFSSQEMSLGWCIFEERENNPPGKRICREYKTPAERKEDREFFGKDSADRGRDETWALKPDDHGGEKTYVLDWTQEREDVLNDIQKAMSVLGTKLSKVLERPELASGTLPLLSAGD